MAAMHRTVERVIEESGIAWTFLRPNNFMQAFIAYDAPTIRAEGIPNFQIWQIRSVDSGLRRTTILCQIQELRSAGLPPA